MIEIVTKFIKNIDLTSSLNLTVSIKTTNHVKTTVKPLIKIEKIINWVKLELYCCINLFLPNKITEKTS